MQKVFSCLLVFITMFFNAQITAKVVGVKDGDTIVVLLEGNTTLTLRLAEVDCPESGQAFGKNAKQFTSSKVFGKEVTYIPTSTDRYGRTIAKVYYGKKYLSRELIRSGNGWWYAQYSKDKSLGKLQEEAQEKQKGLWQDKNPQAPWEYRKEKRNKKKA